MPAVSAIMITMTSVNDEKDHGAANIIGVLARVFVEDLAAATPIYRELAGGEEPVRFGFREVDMTRVGPFLLLSGNTSAYRDRVATVLVRSLETVRAALKEHGGQELEGPTDSPKGRRLIARHPDGSVFEYIESREG